MVVQRANTLLDLVATNVEDIPSQYFLLWIGGIIFTGVIVPAIVAAMKSDDGPQDQRQAQRQYPAGVHPPQYPTHGYPPQYPTHGYPPQYPTHGYPPQYPTHGYPSQYPTESNQSSQEYGKRAFALGSDEFDKDGNFIGDRKRKPPTS